MVFQQDQRRHHHYHGAAYVVAVAAAAGGVDYADDVARNALYVHLTAMPFYLSAMEKCVLVLRSRLIAHISESRSN